ncbi:MAG: hypothetical protein H8F28_12585, partial [Fibrella sp.]|nr:hypothetical protein [Armatimonadota bacterium]
KDNGFDAHPEGNAPKPVGDTAADELPVSRIVYHKASFEERAKRIGRMTGIANIVKEPLPPAEEATSTSDPKDRPADVTVLVGLDVAGREALRQSASRE